MSNTRQVRFTLIDPNNEEVNSNITLAMSYDPDLEKNTNVKDLVLSIGIGDHIARTNVTIPMGMLSHAVAQLMAAHERQKHSGLVDFDKPPIVGIN